MEKFDLYIGGKTCKPAGGECFESFDPYTGKPWARVAKGGAADVERGSRLLVQRQVYDEVVSKVVEMARIARLSDRSDLATQVGADHVQAAGGRHRVDQHLPRGELLGTLRRSTSDQASGAKAAWR